MLLPLHLTLTAFMTGLIWVIQLVHYPLFAHVGTEGYPTYQSLHMRRITFIVAPIMLAELVTALLLLFFPPSNTSTPALWLNLALLALTWLSTALLQVPAHTRLTHGFDPRAHRRLVASNWLRTTLWTARTLLMLYLLTTPALPV